MKKEAPASHSHDGQRARLISWVVTKAELDVASFRYRCLVPASGFVQRGWDVEIVEDLSSLDQNSDVVVFVKAFGPAHLKQAKSLKAAGKAVILDLCDNIYSEGYSHGSFAVSAAGFNAMTRIADAVVVPTRQLASVVSAKAGFSVQERVLAVIPDCALSGNEVASLQNWYRLLVVSSEGTPIAAGIKERLNSALAWLYWLGQWCSAHAAFSMRIIKGILMRQARQTSEFPRKRIVWFGKHGTRHTKTGIISLASIVPSLTSINKRLPLELIVISNNRAKFLRYLSALPFPTVYRRWSNAITSLELNSADLVVLPNLSSDFTATKSSNRALLALSHGVPVVASRLDSISELENCVLIENWEENIERYLVDSQKRENDLALAAKLIDEEFSPMAIHERWRALLERISPAQTGAKQGS